MMNRGEALNKMIALAATSHAGQFDKQDRPYILHPLQVMYFLNTEDEELQCIAVGHDIVEDTDVTLEKLTKLKFSARVVRGIDDLTKRENESLEDYKQRVFSNVDAMRVKQCDLRHNSDIRRLKGITQKDIDRSVRYQTFYMEIEERLRNVTP
jgi:(p)ppGpp synthase/HD superfamily hydrolase